MLRGRVQQRAAALAHRTASHLRPPPRRRRHRRSYQPALWSGLAWFSLAAVAGVSVIAAYLGLLFGAGATATYATLWIVAQQQARLEGRARAQQRLEYAAREHHD